MAGEFKATCRPRAQTDPKLVRTGNALFRAITAGVFPLFGVAFYRRLGLGGGCTLLAGLSILMIPLLYVRTGVINRLNVPTTDIFHLPFSYSSSVALDSELAQSGRRTKPEPG